MRVLIAPLNWGLGHAARCIPIIDNLIHNGIEVIIAADQGPLALLQEYFPSLPFLDFPSLNIEYSTGSNQLVKMMGYVPKLLEQAKKDHLQTQAWVKNHGITHIISDHRYGVWSPSIPSVFITHQLYFKAPDGWQWTEPLLRWQHFNLIKTYDEIWIPDTAQSPGLSGSLSHGSPLPVPPIRFIGNVSRFTRLQEEKPLIPLPDTIAILSGPEPHRSLLEKELTEKFEHHQYPLLIIQGKPGNTPETFESTYVRKVQHLSSPQLLYVCKHTPYLISRPGYTTLLDLASIQRVATWIPTPGQTEQEYLGKVLAKNGQGLYFKQGQFNWERWHQNRSLGIPLSCPESHFSATQILENLKPKSYK